MTGKLEGIYFGNGDLVPTTIRVRSKRQKDFSRSYRKLSQTVSGLLKKFAIPSRMRFQSSFSKQSLRSLKLPGVNMRLNDEKGIALTERGLYARHTRN